MKVSVPIVGEALSLRVETNEDLKKMVGFREGQILIIRRVETQNDNPYGLLLTSATETEISLLMSPAKKFF